MIRKIQLLHQHLKLSRRLIISQVVIGVCLGLGILGSWIFMSRNQQLLSPISARTSFQFLLNPQTDGNHAQRVVYGFLPYWNVNKFTLQPEVTHLAYFSVGIQADGSVSTKDADGHTEPGYAKLSSDQLLSVLNQEKKQGGKNILTFSQFDNSDIANFLFSDAAHQKFIQSVMAALDAYPIDGINIDIEYTGDVSDPLRQHLVSLMTKLHQQFQLRPHPPQLAIDMYANAPSRYDIWDVAAIQQQVDYVVVMAYDFHFAGSTTAGPVAPLLGGDHLLSTDITQNMKDYLALVPKQKILLGIPFYGYKWQTTSTDPQSTTFPDTGSAATFQDVQKLLGPNPPAGISEIKQVWNEDALSPYITYKKAGLTYILYYEDSRSISYKLDLVNQLNLGGIAIWSLGYEGSTRDLWDVIHRKI